MAFGKLAATLLCTASIGMAMSAAAATSTPIAAAQPVTFSIYLPLQNTTALQTLLTAQQTVGSPSYQQWLTPDQFNAQFGPSPAAVAAATAALTAAGLQVSQVDARVLQATGTAAQIKTALHVTLVGTTAADGTARTVSMTKPLLAGALAGAYVPTFSPVPDAKVQSTVVPLANPDNRRSANGGYYYDDLKEAYDYPSYQTVLPNGKQLDGSGVRVGIVMENGALNSDVAAMFNNEKFSAVTGKPNPTFTTVPIDGGGAVMGGGFDEASLDVQQVIGGAPGASVTLYSLPNLSNQGTLDAYEYIVSHNSADIVTSSFGECELFFTAAYNNGFDFTSQLAFQNSVFQQGNAQGISFLASSGDEGGLECPNDLYFATGNKSGHFVPSISSPSDDPNVTAVGGGNLTTVYPVAYDGNPSDPEPSTYVSENGSGDPEIPHDPYGLGVITGGYWGAGGGLSSVFAKPAYQTFVPTGASVRTNPDVGMQVGGCPGGISVTPCGPNRSSVIVWLAGTRYGLIGTSVSSPEFAGAMALLVESRANTANPTGRLGNANYFLYARSAAQTAGVASAAGAYHKNIPGFDGVYSSGSAPYDYIFGNGTPDVRNLFGMQAYAPAGDPQTPSNP